jgi:hypothetical protein
MAKKQILIIYKSIKRKEINSKKKSKNQTK